METQRKNRRLITQLRARGPPGVAALGDTSAPAQARDKKGREGSRIALGTRKAAACRSRLRGPVGVKVAAGPARQPRPPPQQQQHNSQSCHSGRSSMPAPSPGPPARFPFGSSAPPPPGVGGPSCGVGVAALESLLLGPGICLAANFEILVWRGLRAASGV